MGMRKTDGLSKSTDGVRSKDMMTHRMVMLWCVVTMITATTATELVTIHLDSASLADEHLVTALQLGEDDATEMRVRSKVKGPAPVAVPEEIDLDADITQMRKMIADTQVERKDQFIAWNGAREDCDTMRETQRDLEDDVIRQSRMIQLSLEMKLEVGKKRNMMKPGEVDPEDKYTQMAKVNKGRQQKSIRLMKIKRAEAEHTGDTVTSIRKKFDLVESRYRWALQHLQLKQSQGCFVHDGQRYCIGVTKWCGEGSATHPCSEEEQKEDTVEETQDVSQTDETAKVKEHTVEETQDVSQTDETAKV